MDNFSYSRPATLRDARAQLGQEHGQVALLAGGTDLLGEMKDDMLAPERLVHIKHLRELQGIQPLNTGLRIGAGTLLVDVVESPTVQQQVPLLAMAAERVGTPQIRNMGTLGGNLCQRPRCWYFRNNYPCLKRGGDRCYAVAGGKSVSRDLDGGAIVHCPPIGRGAGPGGPGSDGADCGKNWRANRGDGELLRDSTRERSPGKHPVA